MRQPRVDVRASPTLTLALIPTLTPTPTPTPTLTLTLPPTPTRCAPLGLYTALLTNANAALNIYVLLCHSMVKMAPLAVPQFCCYASSGRA